MVARADAAEVEATRIAGRTERLGDEVRQARLGLAALKASTAKDLADAEAIDKAVAAVLSLRKQIVKVRGTILLLRGEQGTRQADVDLLASCQNALGRALGRADDSLTAAPPSPDGAVLNLEFGRTTCQKAMQAVNGHTGAVHPYDFPDPSAIQVGGTYYAYGTNGPGGAVQVLTSRDMRSWQLRASALPVLPAWAEPGHTWSPSVTKVGEAYALYYAVRIRGTHTQCISVAGSRSPIGPFIDWSSGPMICQQDLAGSIDPSPYWDETGGLRLTWKSEEDANRGRSRIWSQHLTPDGLHLVGLPSQLLAVDQSWEGRTIEGPSMAKVGDAWVLLYSGNTWSTDRYAIGAAFCDGPDGPCHSQRQPLVASSPLTKGPGGAEFFRATDGSLHAVYAAWDAQGVGYPNPRRLHVAEVTAPDGHLTIT